MSLKRLLNPENDGGYEWGENNPRFPRRRVEPEFYEYPQSFESESIEPYVTSQNFYDDTSFGDQYVNLDDIFPDVTQLGDQFFDPDGISLQMPDSLLLPDDSPSLSTPVTEPSGHSETDADIPMTDISDNIPKEQICYGMIYNEKVKLVGKGQELEKKVQELNKSKLNVARLQTFRIRKSIDQDQLHLFLTFTDGNELGYLSEKLAQAFKDLIDEPSVETDAVANLQDLSDAIRRAEKPSDAAIRVEINVYGPSSDRDRIGWQLSDKGVFLQEPDHCRPGMRYDNPHTLRLEGMDESDTNDPTSEGQVDEDSSEPSSDPNEEFDETIAEVLGSLRRGEGLQRVEGSDKLNNTLLPHQKEALDFMAQRETGEIPSEYRLWQPKTIGGEQWYCHSITNAREREQPDESGGGILADEMGMGKSLTTLALIEKTLVDGRKWVEEQEDSGGILAKQPTRATLVVVPSLVLINTWEREITRHLDESMILMKYHGPNRKKSIEMIDGFDIVITTYNTLAKEHGSWKGGRSNSPLHNFAWYRVVLDEAHMIRRQATTFHRAMIDLTAKSRWCLSGTPIQNTLTDLGALLAFIQVKPFHNMSTFRYYIANPFSERATKQRAIEKLVRLLEALCLRRTRERIKIPGQNEQTRVVEFTPEELNQYNETKQLMYRSIAHQAGEYNRSSTFGMFQVFLQLRILCNHGTYQHYFTWSRRSLLDEEEDAVCSYTRSGLNHCSGCRQPLPISLRDGFRKYVENCKHILCKDCLAVSSEQSGYGEGNHCPLCKPLGASSMPLDMTDASSSFLKASRRNRIEGRQEDDYFRPLGCSSKMKALITDVQKDLETTKSIIFSCWTRTLRLIAKHLNDLHIRFIRIDGGTPSAQRQKLLDDFENNKNIPILIMTTGTGAFGLNLQKVNRVFIIEPQWNPSVESQAISRAIRLGQEQQVLVIRYRVKDSIEEDMCAQQQKKLKLGNMNFKKDFLPLQLNTSTSRND